MQATLQAADEAYYQCLPPLMTDADYDALARESNHVADLPPGFTTLENAICESEFLAWTERAPGPYLIQFKLDGVCVHVTFRNGVAVAARTRKLDITPRVYVPARGNFSGVMVGELWSSLGRDYVAAHLRRKVNPGPDCAIHFTDHDAASLNIARNADTRVALRLWVDWKAGQLRHQSPTDGLVVKVADHSARAALGEGSRSPNWAIALK